MSGGHYSHEDQQRELRKQRRSDAMRDARLKIRGIRETVRDTTLAEVQVTVLRTTPRGVLLRGPKGEEEWLPRSVIADGDGLEVDSAPRTISVAMWKLDELGWA